MIIVTRSIVYPHVSLVRLVFVRLVGFVFRVLAGRRRVHPSRRRHSCWGAAHGRAYSWGPHSVRISHSHGCGWGSDFVRVSHSHGCGWGSDSVRVPHSHRGRRGTESRGNISTANRAGRRHARWGHVHRGSSHHAAWGPDSPRVAHCNRGAQRTRRPDSSGSAAHRTYTWRGQSGGDIRSGWSARSSSSHPRRRAHPGRRRRAHHVRRRSGTSRRRSGRSWRPGRGWRRGKARLLVRVQGFHFHILSVRRTVVVFDASGFGIVPGGHLGQGIIVELAHGRAGWVVEARDLRSAIGVGWWSWGLVGVVLGHD